MSSDLRIGLLIASLFVFLLILYCVIHKKFYIKYSIAWLLWALLILLMVIFPDAFYEFSHLLGIEMPVNAVFLITVSLLYALVFYVYVMISKHNEEIIRLTYSVASLTKENNDLKERLKSEQKKKNKKQ